MNPMAQYIQRLSACPKTPFAEVYTIANPAALDLLDKLLQFDPAQRVVSRGCTSLCTAAEAPRHPYLAAYHDEVIEGANAQTHATIGRLFDPGANGSLDSLRERIFAEAQRYQRAAMQSYAQPGHPDPAEAV
ncbi:hypothetical protein T492DRAFT_848844 [Pavlovales sp. CCMP2436]|nr:hypothetical protein T492DRAFT_848844 [Pavlovales sp. CCMP2436]